jgi:hypothetical protein
MSGRLVILPKKSYCPWKPENIERILRDERLESDRQEKESRLCRLVAENNHTTSRLCKLRQLKQLESTTSKDTTKFPHLDGDSNLQDFYKTRKHVNLFQKEEDECASGCISEESKPKNDAVGIMPVMFGQSELQARGDNLPFYLRAQSFFNQNYDHSYICPKEESRKNNLDPMKDFIDSTVHSTTLDCIRSQDTNSVLSESSRKRRRKHRSRSHRHRHEKKKKSKNDRRHDGREKYNSSDDDCHDRQVFSPPRKPSPLIHDDRCSIEKLQKRQMNRGTRTSR